MREYAIIANSVSKRFVGRNFSFRSLFSEGSSAVQALSSVSFSIEKGETTGIVGGNGSGKTTLLRMLAGISRPTSGQIEVEGAVATLLEVGAGMHPDLTGRQNIAISASLMGMSAGQIARTTDQIIAFASIGEAIDRPMRTYSSGMRLRLGFAVAAHVDAPIVALDEALAVGDTAFQARCLNKIFELRNSGRTILFVSHDLGAVRKLCSRTLVLERGHLVFDGPTDQAIAFYRKLVLPGAANNRVENPDRSVAVALDCDAESPISDSSVQLTIRIETSQSHTGKEIDLGLHINDLAGNRIHHFSNKFTGLELRADGNLLVVVNFENHLKPGRYAISLYLALNDAEVFWLPDAFALEVNGLHATGFHRPEAMQAPVVVPFNMVVK